MHFWEIHFSVDYAAAIETKINLPFENDNDAMDLRLTYDLDGSLYMTNGSSRIWHVSVVLVHASDFYSFKLINLFTARRYYRYRRRLLTLASG